MIYLAYAEIPETQIDEEKLKRIFSCAYIDDITNRKNENSVRESFAALALLAEALKALNIDTQGLRIIKDENGRPYFEGNSEVDFSISHSGKYVACAVSTMGRVGVDAEKIPENGKYEKIADRFFSERERENTKSARDFARIWTRKEAYYKYLASGGALVSVDSEKSENVCIESFLIEDDYFLSICSKKSNFICKSVKKIGIN